MSAPIQLAASGRKHYAQHAAAIFDQRNVHSELAVARDELFSAVEWVN